MGLFSGKKTTYRDFSYSRIIEDDYLPNVIGQAITTYILDDTNTKSLVDLMLEYGWKANNVKWDAAYRWAAKPDKYFYGVPTVSTVAVTDFTGAESLEEVLQTLTGQQDLTYVYSNFMPMNFRHSMRQLLVNNYNYNATTNILAGLEATVGTTCWLNNATNYLTAATREAVTSEVLEHWGYSPTSGATNTRAQNLAASDTADAVSTTGENFVRVEYACSFAGVQHIETVETTKITTTVRTPDGSGGYTDVVTETTSDTTTNETNWNGFTLPDDTISAVDVETATNTTNETDPTESTTDTDETTGVITIVDTDVSRVITTKTVSVNVIAYQDMSFGDYDYNPSSETIDTGTVLDDNDSGNYETDDTLVPSGEDTEEDPDLFMVCYQYTLNGTLHIGYFTYEYGSGDYPALDGISGTTVSDFGQHFPRMYFRLDGNRLDKEENADTEAYKTSKKMGRKLDLPWLTVSNEVYSAMSSVSKVRDIMMIMAVEANTENAIEQEYLFRYFYTLAMLRPVITQSDWTTQSTENANTGSDDVPDTDWVDLDVRQGCVVDSTDTYIDNSIIMDNLAYRKVTGTLDTGVESGYVEDGEVPIRYAYRNADGTLTYKYGTSTASYHFYRLQTSDTEYEEVRVYGLAHRVRVGGKNISKAHENEQLMVPLDHAFRKLFSPHDRETLYARATKLLVCTEYTVKTKWYQTGIFQAVVVVIAVVVSWWTAGASMSLVGVLTAAASAIGTSLALSLLGKYVFSKLGGSFAILAYVVAAVAAAYGGYSYFSGTAGPFSITATQLMQISNVAFTAGQSAQQGVIAKEMARIATLEQEIADKQEALETANKELSNPYNTIEDSVLLRALSGYTYLGESPMEYFSRTLNTNIGVETNGLVDMYYSQSLALPSDVAINQSIMQNIGRPFELLNNLEDDLNQTEAS